MMCPCGSEREYELCCKRLIEEGVSAATPEALMRSRYTAYTQGNGRYLVDTTVASRRVQSDAELIAEHAKNTEWLGLEVLETHEYADLGSVEFKAYYRENGRVQVHHEKSRFLRQNGRWYYDEGTLYEAKVGRNDPCPCGSGKKYKKCCGR